jgi:hypothetical protein
MTTAPDNIEVRTAKDVLGVLEQRRGEIGVAMREVSGRAGYAHAAYWYWARRGGKVGLDAALCYLRTLGYRVVLVRDNPLV